MARPSALPRAQPPSLVSHPPPPPRHALDRRRSRPLSVAALAALAVLLLTAVAALVLSVLAAVVFRLSVPGDVPSRALVFAAATLSVVEGALQAAVAVAAVRRRRQGRRRRQRPRRPLRRSDGPSTAARILAHVVLAAWIASVVLSSLLVAERGGVSLAAPLADQAVYVGLALGVVSLLSSAVLSFCIERRAAQPLPISQPYPVKAAAKDELTDDMDVDDNDMPPVFDFDLPARRSSAAMAMRTSLITGGAAAARLAGTLADPSVRGSRASGGTEAEAGAKRLLFSYKSTTELGDHGWRPAPSPARETTDAPVRAPTIKRKPVHAAVVAGDDMAVDVDVAPAGTHAPSYLSPTASSYYSDDGADGADGVAGADKAEANNTVRDSIPGRGPPVRLSHVRLMPYSPAVARPASVVPPLPTALTAPAAVVMSSEVRAGAQSMLSSELPASPESPEPLVPPQTPGRAPIKRRPVGVSAAATRDAQPLLSETPSRPSAPSTLAAAPSLGSMVASSLRRVSAATTAPAVTFVTDAAERRTPSRTPSQVLAASVAALSASMAALPGPLAGPQTVPPTGPQPVALPPTRSVLSAQPRVLDQPVVRRSFVALTTSGSGSGASGSVAPSRGTGSGSFGGGLGLTMASGSRPNSRPNSRPSSVSSSRRPSEVSIMETIYSPGGDGEQVEEDAAAEAERDRAERARDASRLSFTSPTTTTSTVPTTSVRERKMSISRKPSLSPVTEQAQELSEADEEEQDEMVDDENVMAGDTHVRDETVTVPAADIVNGLSRPARRIHKETLAPAAAQPPQTTQTMPTAPAAETANATSLTRKPSHNFSRPLRAATAATAAAAARAAARVDARRASLLTPSDTTGRPRSATATARAGLPVLSPRSRVRRQLLQMLPAQHQPRASVALAVTTRETGTTGQTATTAAPRSRMKLSRRRQRRSLALNLSPASRADAEAEASDDEYEDVEDSDDGDNSDHGDSGDKSEDDVHVASAASELNASLSSPVSPGGRHSHTRRSRSLARTAQRAQRRSSVARDWRLSRASSHMSHAPQIPRTPQTPYTPYTPRNRPISPMTLLIQRNQ